MPSATKAVLVLALAVVGLWWTQDARRSPALVDEQALAAWVDRARAALAQGAGIVLPQDVPVVLLDAEGARARRRAFLADRPDAHGLAATVDFVTQHMFGESLLGRYLPDEQAIYIMQDTLLAQSGGDVRRAEALLFPVLAHELVHAYDAQTYGCVPEPSALVDVLQDPSRLGQLQALMSLLEGRATHASTLACRVAGIAPLPEPTVEDVREAELLAGDGSLGGDMLASLGNSVGRIKLMQYAYGVRFAQRAFAYGGEPFFAQVFAHLPLELAELEDFDRFVVRWAEDLEAQQDAAEAAGAVHGEDARTPDAEVPTRGP